MSDLVWFAGSMAGMASDPYNWIVLAIALVALRMKYASLTVPSVLLAGLLLKYWTVQNYNTLAGYPMGAHEIIVFSWYWFAFHAIGIGIWYGVSSATEKLRNAP